MDYENEDFQIEIIYLLKEEIRIVQDFTFVSRKVYNEETEEVVFEVYFIQAEEEVIV